MVKITIENFDGRKPKEYITDQFLVVLKEQNKNIMYLTRKNPNNYCAQVKGILENLKIKGV